MSSTMAMYSSPNDFLSCLREAQKSPFIHVSSSSGAVQFLTAMDSAHLNNLVAKRIRTLREMLVGMVDTVLPSLESWEEHIRMVKEQFRTGLSTGSSLDMITRALMGMEPQPHSNLSSFAATDETSYKRMMAQLGAMAQHSASISRAPLREWKVRILRRAFTITGVQPSRILRDCQEAYATTIAYTVPYVAEQVRRYMLVADYVIATTSDPTTPISADLHGDLTSMKQDVASTARMMRQWSFLIGAWPYQEFPATATQYEEFLRWIPTSLATDIERDALGNATHMPTRHAEYHTALLGALSHHMATVLKAAELTTQKGHAL